MKLSGTGLLLLLLALAGCGGLPPSTARLAPLEEPLPALFGPLTWELTRDEAMALFPGKETRDDIPGYDNTERLAVVMTWGLDWPELGPASSVVAHDGSGRVRWLSVDTAEEREACFMAETPPPSLACRFEYGPWLTTLFERLKADLSKSYGKPRTVTDRLDDWPQDKRQRAVLWARAGFDLWLGLTVDEGGAWAVTLHASRQRLADD